MSLHSLKEALLISESECQPRSPPHRHHPPSLPTRRPPKTSLSQQLLRLESSSSSSFPAPPPRPSPASNAAAEDAGKPDDEEETDDEGPRVRRRAPLPPAPALDSRGPYEPLLLSPPEERPVVQVPSSINCRLLAHQRDGVRFLYNLYRNNHGGVLGDDMGLGKTIQTIAFLSAVIGKDNDHTEQVGEGRRIGPILILCPTSVIRNWENEFAEWARCSVAVYHGPNRDLVLQKVEAQVLEIIITSFDTFRIHDKILCGIPWDLVVVDEAHRLKNEKSKLYTACLGITTQKRFGLTGTIMQNKIMELFNLFDWVVPGCLGDREHFRMYYDEPLKHGQRFSAPERFVQVADKRKKHLVSVLSKFLLRRTKEETIGHLMLGKEDNIVFCRMSDVQKRVYRRMLQQPDVQVLINKDLPCSCGSPLTQVECCKRIEPHGIIWSYLHRENPEGCSLCPFCLVLPCLGKLQQISNHLELIKPNPKDEIEKQKKDAELAAAVFDTDIELVGGGAKSENFMGLSDAEHCGKMRNLGVNLVSANHVVIFDPSWNPAQDLQAQDRSFRFGQRRHVTVFRLLGAGSLEELVYSRQIYKQQLSNIAVSGKIEKRYFEGVQDDKKFQGELFGICNLFRDLSDKLFTSEIIEMHGEQGKGNIAETTGIREIVDTNKFGTLDQTKSPVTAIDNENENLDHCGIVYVHRNEDVVNTRTKEGSNCDKSVPIHLELQSNNEVVHTVRAKSYSLVQKKKEFNRIASFMGMNDLEFSKWLLSVSPLQRHEVLDRYRNRK
uniref:Helicase ATP-binding domain-containing protein n=1 Tax=Leersia perrieri TaxID=77586 RepID=A0A0D9WMJ1_9ORYZ